MTGEPEQGGAGDRLDQSVQVLKLVWFGLFAGGIMLTAAVVVLVMIGAGGQANFGPAKYIFLLPVPFGLFAAFTLASWLTTPNPVSAADMEHVPANLRPNYDDPMHWYPAYMTQFFLRAGFLEGCMVLCAIGFFITGDWAILAGPVILLAAFLAAIPTRGGAEAFAEVSRQKVRGEK